MRDFLYVFYIDFDGPMALAYLAKGKRLLAKFDIFEKQNTLYINVDGDWTNMPTSDDARRAIREIKKSSQKKCIISSEKLGRWDTGLLVFLKEILQYCAKNNISVDYNKLHSGVRQLLDLAQSDAEFVQKNSNKKMPILDTIGESAINFAGEMKKVWKFIGEIFASFGRLVRKRAIFRGVDLWAEFGAAGISALPIVALISFMIGLIIAFVGAIQLKMFGAQVYVASLVAISMIRILGAIMTGIIMAGRTGASYAATIGSMQINEEGDALKTMGVSVVDFLVLPRVIALTVLMPILTVFADIIGILGGAIVSILFLGISAPEYYDMTMWALSFNNFAVGVFHGYIYGWIIAICGCYCGIQTVRSADGIGRATTRAVVSSIVWCIIATAVLTMLFTWLDI